ncbi:hypothetical protein K0U83_20340, partial [bacterium]|nr:hypothetical protein [bacterium]
RHFAGSGDIVEQLVKQGNLPARVSEGLNDFFANKPQGKELKNELDLYTNLPYAAAGLAVGLILGYYLRKP